MRRTVLLQLLILCALTLTSCSAPSAQSQPPLRAIIEADCAPWDGAAFTIAIPIDTGRLIRISIYQAPDSGRRETYTFPDSTGRIGSAVYRPEFGPEEAVTGTVTLNKVAAGMPVEGVVDLQSSGGFRYHGPILANWGRLQSMCG